MRTRTGRALMAKKKTEKQKEKDSFEELLELCPQVDKCYARLIKVLADFREKKIEMEVSMLALIKVFAHHTHEYAADKRNNGLSIVLQLYLEAFEEKENETLKQTAKTRGLF